MTLLDVGALLLAVALSAVSVGMWQARRVRRTLPRSPFPWAGDVSRRVVAQDEHIVTCDDEVTQPNRRAHVVRCLRGWRVEVWDWEFGVATIRAPSEAVASGIVAQLIDEVCPHAERTPDSPPPLDVAWRW